MPATSTGTEIRVQEVRSLTDLTYVLRFDRNGMEFEPGQYVAVGVRGSIDMREYSVYSDPAEDYLEILVKEVSGGQVSKDLHRLGRGDLLSVDGPFGFFTIDPEARGSGKMLFVGTGTGLSPFHCFANAYPDLDYTLLHGVRTLEERYEYGVFDPARVTTCVSRDHPDTESDKLGSFFPGRVTAYLRENPVSPDTLCYLCGNCDMIYEAFDVLKNHGVPPEHLFAEVYF